MLQGILFYGLWFMMIIYNKRINIIQIDFTHAQIRVYWYNVTVKTFKNKVVLCDQTIKLSKYKIINRLIRIILQ